MFRYGIHDTSTKLMHISDIIYLEVQQHVANKYEVLYFTSLWFM